MPFTVWVCLSTVVVFLNVIILFQLRSGDSHTTSILDFCGMENDPPGFKKSFICKEIGNFVICSFVYIEEGI